MLIREILFPFTTGSNYLEDLLSRFSKDTFAQQEWCIWIGLGSNNCLEGNILIIENHMVKFFPKPVIWILLWWWSGHGMKQVLQVHLRIKVLKNIKNPSYPGGSGSQN